jgi:PAS domain S-box-containing protein
MERILLIDSNSSTARSVTDITDNEYSETVVACTTEQALLLIKNEHFDLVVLRPDMKEISCRGLLKKIREIKPQEALPVIVLNNSVTVDDFKIPAADPVNKVIRDIIDCIPIITILVDNDVKILHANYAATTFADKPVSSIFQQLGGNAFNCIHALSNNGNCGKTGNCDLCIIRNTVNHTFRTGESIYRKEGTFTTSVDGQTQTLDILISTTSLQINSENAVLMSIDDVTAFKNALREMKEGRDIYAFQAEELSQLMKYIDVANDKLQSEKDIIQTIFNTSNIGIGITDQTGRYIMFNNWLTEHLGYTEDEMKNLTFNEITHPDYIEEINLLFRKLIKGENNGYRVEKKYVRKDGSFFWGELSVSILRDKENNITHIIGIIRDISESKETTEALIKNQVALKELNATKDKLFSIISHDLRNSFNAILGLSNLLTSSFSEYTTEEIKEFIEAINSTSNSTYTLLENLLEWAKSQQNKITFKPEKTDLLAIANECLLIFENQVQLKGIVIKNNLPEGLFLKADKEMMKTILRNLISNAIKFTNKGSFIEIKADIRKTMAEIAVSDSGVGMTKETKQSLFKIVNSKSIDGTAGEKGTGLGLILCKEFVEMHGGEIWVESEPGKGSSFMFKIPLFQD